MTNLDMVYATLKHYEAGEVLCRADIIRLVHDQFGVPKGSIIPSDYCYNRVNIDKLGNPTLLNFNIFEYRDAKHYIYLGKDNRYSGPIFHMIDFREQQVGLWVDGVRTLWNSFGEKVIQVAKYRKEKCKDKTYIHKDLKVMLTIPEKPYSNNTGVNHLWHMGSKTDWENALKDYWGAVSSANMKLEQDFERLDPEQVRGMNPEQFYSFLHDEYFVWKYTAKNRLTTTRRSLKKYMDRDRVGELGFVHQQLFSFDHNDIERGLSLATQIHGLGTAGASGLLSVLFPSDFGTVDQFVVKALCEIEGLKEHAPLSNMSPLSLTPRDGVIIISILRRKASELNLSFETNIWTPRKIDMVLWAVGRV
jgi:hypothetical protein